MSFCTEKCAESRKSSSKTLRTGAEKRLAPGNFRKILEPFDCKRVVKRSLGKERKERGSIGEVHPSGIGNDV
jgi:hypothetical protein